MKSTTNLTVAKLRKFLLVTALVICPLLAIQSTSAQSVATATLTSGGMTSITIGQNGTFVLTLGVTTNFVSSGYTVFYQSASGNGLFQLTGRTNLSPINAVTGGPVFDDPTTSDAVAFGGTAGILNPSNMFDLGYTGDQTNNQPPGTFLLQSVNVSALNIAPGTYTIFLDNRSIMVDRPVFQDVNMGGPTGPMFTVTVVPEPTTVALAVLGGAALLVFVWRKQHARA